MKLLRNNFAKAGYLFRLSHDKITHHEKHFDEAADLLKNIPKPDVYKLEDAPKLIKVQRDLNKLGLKDPWIRNYVYLYDPKTAGTIYSRVKELLFIGVWWGLYAFIISLGIMKLYRYYHPYDPKKYHDELMKRYGVDVYSY